MCVCACMHVYVCVRAWRVCVYVCVNEPVYGFNLTIVTEYVIECILKLLTINLDKFSYLQLSRDRLEILSH